MEIKVTLSEAGIDKAIRELERYERQVEDRCQRLVDRLVQMGIPIARANFSSAQYDGTNDVTVRSETDGTYTAIVAEGNAVLFIEFGTGVYYAEAHPEAGVLGMERGTYGQGRGSRRSWRYYGDPGTNGEEVKTTDKGVLVQTHGNPANRSLYDTGKYLESVVRQAAREVFKA